MHDLPHHVSRVVRAAVAWALGEPGVGAASAELLAAVSEMRRINNYKQGEGPERENGHEQSDDHDGTGACGQDTRAVRGGAA
jgi:hypothetical protein